MGKIDPRERMKERKEKGWSEEPEGGGSGPSRVDRELKAPALPVGYAYEKASTGTKGIKVRFVLVEGPQEGRVTEATFWKSSIFNDSIADFALSLGYQEPFDPWDADDFERVLASGPVGLDIRAEDPYVGSDGKEHINYRPRFFFRFREVPEKGSDRRAAWVTHKKAGEESWDNYLDWREKQAEKRASGGGSGGGKSKAKQADDDDGIPF